jgi:hypothetical protein
MLFVLGSRWGSAFLHGDILSNAQNIRLKSLLSTFIFVNDTFTSRSGKSMDFVKDLAAPIFLAMLGMIGKWLVKRKWDDEIVFMGPDLVLAGVGAAIAGTGAV